MKTLNLKKYLMGILFAGLVVLLGCRPSIHDVIKVLSTVSLGTSRAEIRSTLVKAYPNKLQPYDLAGSPIPMTEEAIQDAKNLITAVRKDGRFTCIYPTDLFAKLPSKTFSDSVGIIKEAAINGGLLEIIYDSNTNYIGFFAESYK